MRPGGLAKRVYRAGGTRIYFLILEKRHDQTRVTLMAINQKGRGLYEGDLTPLSRGGL